ncbi:hypothetical protein O0L34_g12969 [Tuta absoluta]|nr:hypothetical protein O0L34_g12969 [Tuta absoluta]
MEHKECDAEEEQNKEDVFIEVRNKKRKNRSEVMIGENSQAFNLRAIEKKKYLLVWYLDPDTTTDELLEHIKSQCRDGCGAVDDLPQLFQKADWNFRKADFHKLYALLESAD